MPSATYRTTAFVEAARRLGIELTVASEVPSTFEQAQPASLVTLDFSHPDRAVEQARSFHQRFRIDAVLGVDDDTVVVAAHVATALGLPGIPVAAARAARDKHLQRVTLAAQRVRVPAFALHNFDEPRAALAAEVEYPCVIKPLRLAASRGVMRANARREFVAAVDRLEKILQSCGDASRQFLVERFVPGPEVALEGLLIDGRLQVLALFDKPDPLDGPFFEETIYVTPSRHSTEIQEAVAHITQDAATALRLRTGPIHAELRLGGRDGVHLIELAARSIGGRCSAALRFGDDRVSPEEIVLRQALGMELPALQREARAAGVMMIPIPRAGRLREVQGIADARAVSGIDDVVITAHPGEELVPFPEGSRYPGFIFARGDTPARVEAALREAHRRLRFVLS